MMDSLTWKKRMRYAWNASDIVVAVSEKVKDELMEAGVSEQRVLVIGEDNPYKVTDRVVAQYYDLYSKLTETL